MTEHKVGTREEWLAARLELLEAEKAHTRRGDELTKMRKELPWVRIDKGYTFDTEGGEAWLPDLFRGRSQLLIYHFMFDPDWDEGCPSCSAIADGFDETYLHLQNHDVAFTAVPRRRSRSCLPTGTGWAGASRGPRPDGATSTYDFHVTIDASLARWSTTTGPSRARGGRRRLARVVRREAWHERLRARGRRRVPHLLRVRPGLGRALDHVAVARPGAARPQRGRPVVVPPPRPVRGQLPMKPAHIAGGQADEAGPRRPGGGRPRSAQSVPRTRGAQWLRRPRSTTPR